MVDNFILKKILREKIYIAFDEAGIEIPLSKRVIYIANCNEAQVTKKK